MGDIRVDISEDKKQTIHQIFSSMDLNSAQHGLLEAESDSPAKKWLRENRDIGTFIDGKFVETTKRFAVKSRCDSEEVANIFISEDVSLRAAFSVCTEMYVENSRHQWSEEAFQRMECLNKIGQNIEKHKQLLALLECISTGKSIRRVRTLDIPLLIQSFYHYSSLAIQFDSCKYEQIGVAYIVAYNNNYPTMSISWHIAAALAAGNSVILEVEANSSLSALFLAHIFKISGLPDGVFSVLSSTSPLLCSVDEYFPVQNIFFSGPYKEYQLVEEWSLARGLQFEASCSGDGAMAVVLEGADLQSAVCGVLEMFSADVQSSASFCCTVLIQDSIKECFTKLLLARFDQLVMGSNLSNADFPFVYSKVRGQEKTLGADQLKQSGAMVKTMSCPQYNGNECPSIVYDIQTSFLSMDHKFAGPVLALLSFRTTKEAIAICNHKKSGSNVSVWCEKLTTSLEVAHSLKSPNVWINGQNVFDTSACYGSAYASGSATEGGTWGFYRFLIPRLKTPAKSMSIYSDSPISVDKNYLNETFLIYSGGAFKQADGCSSRAVYNNSKQHVAFVPDGSRKDIRNAVESATAAQLKWHGLTSFNRSRILLSLAKNFKSAQKQFNEILHNSCGFSIETCQEEVAHVSKRLLSWAGMCGKFDGRLKDTQLHGKVMETHKPLGVIGIVGTNESPLLSFVSMVLPAIVFGNSVTVVPSEKFPLPALRMCKLFHSSGIPGGVINVVTGCAETLTKELAQHMDVDSLWIPEKYCKAALNRSATNRKRFWVNPKLARVWWQKQNEETDLQYLLNSTYTKTIWIPTKDIFAN